MKHNKIFFISNADQLVIGDEVLVQGNNEVKPAKVTNVSSHTMQGNHETSDECDMFSNISYTHSNVKLEKIVPSSSHILVILTYSRR